MIFLIVMVSIAPICFLLAIIFDKVEKKRAENKKIADEEHKKEVTADVKLKLDKYLDVAQPNYKNVVDYIITLYDKFEIGKPTYLEYAIDESESLALIMQKVRLKVYRTCAKYSYYYNGIITNEIAENANMEGSYFAKTTEEKVPYVSDNKFRAKLMESQSKLSEVEINYRYQQYLKKIKKTLIDDKTLISSPEIANIEFNFNFHNSPTPQEYLKKFGQYFQPLPLEPCPELYEKNRTIRQRLFQLRTEGLETEKVKEMRKNPDCEIKYLGHIQNTEAIRCYNDLINALIEKVLKENYQF